MIKRGFTLIELMVVVAILGILAAVLVPAYQNYKSGNSARRFDPYAPKEVCVGRFKFVSSGGQPYWENYRLTQLIDKEGRGIPCTQNGVER